MNRPFLSLIFLFMLLVACGGSDSNLSAEAESAFKDWAERTGIPYRNESLIIESNDDTFASVRLVGELRMDAESDWYQYAGSMLCRKIDDNWRCEDASMTLTDEGSAKAAQATAEAEQRIAEAIQLVWDTPLAGQTSENGLCIHPEVWEQKVPELSFINPTVHYAIFKIENTDSVAYEVELKVIFSEEASGRTLTPELRQTHLVNANSAVLTSFEAGSSTIDHSVRYKNNLGIAGELVPIDVPVWACIEFLSIQPFQGEIPTSIIEEDRVDP